MMLATSLGCAVEPIYFVVDGLAPFEGQCRSQILFTAAQYAHGDGRGVHPALTLSGRHPLKSMSPSFLVKLFSTRAFKGECDELVPGARIRAGFGAVLSAFAVGQPNVGQGQIRNKQACVFPAFCGADFEGAFFSFHESSPSALNRDVECHVEALRRMPLQP